MEPDTDTKSKNGKSQVLAQDLEEQKNDSVTSVSKKKNRTETEIREARRTQAMRFGLNAPLYGLE